MSTKELVITNKLRGPSIIRVSSRVGGAGESHTDVANIFMANLSATESTSNSYGGLTIETVTAASIQSLFYSSNGVIEIKRVGDAGVAASANANLLSLQAGTDEINFTKNFNALDEGKTKNIFIEFVDDAQGTVILKVAKVATYNPAADTF
jgi:hypothetical protein|tara:strand:- start:2338 stop:2790 length:453 start_codon:yes stop_codon:yes gene_type:complete